MTGMEILFVGLALAVGAGVAWAIQGQAKAKLAKGLETAQVEATALRATADEARRETARLQGKLESADALAGDLDKARGRIEALTGEAEGLRAAMKAAEARHGEQVEQLTRLRQEVQDQFKLLAGEVVKAGSEDFLKRADELFKTQKQLTAAEIDKRAETLVQIVKPLGESLTAYEAMLKEIEKARIENYGGLAEALGQVRAQQDEVKTVTAHLVNALKAAPKTRGRWGEETLKNVVELSGMVEHCDFDREFNIPDEDLRPDMVIRVSGGRSIVVDAKVSLSAYLDAVNATSEEDRQQKLVQHAKELRNQLTKLSNKSYWKYFDDTVDYVVMFVPGDNFVAAAFERDPDLFEDGIKNRVLVCTPTTFIALVKAISYGWRQEQLAQSAKEIGRLGKELYGRLRTFGGHIQDMGKALSRSVDKYNAMVGSLETSVMPQARRFNELGVEGTGEPLAPLEEIPLVPRLPQGGRDLELPPTDGETGAG